MDALDNLADELVAKAAPKLVDAFIRGALAHLGSKQNPLLTATEAAKYLRCGPQKIRRLVAAGAIKRAPGFGEIRIRQSELDSYAK